MNLTSASIRRMIRLATDATSGILRLTIAWCRYGDRASGPSVRVTEIKREPLQTRNRIKDHVILVPQEDDVRIGIEVIVIFHDNVMRWTGG